METTCTIGIIGGSGIYNLEGLKVCDELQISTPFGEPSDKILIGQIEDLKIAFLPRHGKNHTILPSEINYRANIFALKSLGVRYILSLSACGSLREDIHPGDLVLVDQFLDQTKLRASTFFGNGIVGHVSCAHPTCSAFRKLLLESVHSFLAEKETKLHDHGTYINIEGPAFSSRAESLMYRQWGAHIIGMTASTEAKLCLEAEIAYCVIGLVTDYDCWKEGESCVDAASVIEVMHKNGKISQQVIPLVIKRLKAEPFHSAAHDALKNAICTSTACIPQGVRDKMRPLFGRYLS